MAPVHVWCGVYCPNTGIIYISAGTGEITVAKSLLTLTATTVKLSIVASDITKSTGTFILNVPITGKYQIKLSKITLGSLFSHQTS